jgi:hypothetical protein
MELKNQFTMNAPRATVFRVMTEPEYLLKTMPGLKTLTPTDSGTYDAVLEIGVAAVRGRYQGTMRMVESHPPDAYRLQMEGKGPGTFVKLDLGVNLEEPEAGKTTVQYQGDAQVGGTLAGVGQRMLGGVASMIMGQFLKAVDREARELGGD